MKKIIVLFAIYSFYFTPVFCSEANKININTNNIPDYAYRDDNIHVDVVLGMTFGNKKDVNATVAAMVEDRIIMQPHKIKIPAFGKPGLAVSIPLDFSKLNDRDVVMLELSVNKKDKKKSAILTIADSSYEKTIPVTINNSHYYSQSPDCRVLFMIPRYDETAQRRWAPFIDALRLKNWHDGGKLHIVTGNNATDNWLSHMRKKFSKVNVSGGADTPLSAIFIKSLEMKTDSRDTILFYPGLQELENNVPLNAMREKIIAVLSSLENSRARIFTAPPPPYPANPQLRNKYAGLLKDLSEHRGHNFIDYGLGGAIYETTEVPQNLQNKIGISLAQGIENGPGLPSLVFIPFIIISASLWWLRRYSRYLPSKSK